MPCRARTGLNWSQQDLSERAKVGLSTVKDFESANRKPIPNNLQAMQHALELGGIRMVDDPKGHPIGIEINRR